MSDLDLGDYESDAAPAEATVDIVADMLTRARHEAILPKPKIKEMIEAVTFARAELEDREMRMVRCGFRRDFDKTAMRRAMTLAAVVNFLLLCEAKAAAVKRALGET